MKPFVVGIRPPAQSEIAIGKQVANVWFPSVATMAAVLSEDNRALLRTIRDKQPKSLTQLAELTGRLVPNLSRTLRMMEGYGLVKLEKHVRDVQPSALATQFIVMLN
jgi:predicted transcriptional regulator